jgi:hypothetical protein
LRQSLRRYGLDDVLNDPALFAALLHLKVALIGNMNNNFFSVAHYLTDLGIDATLLLFPFEIAHFLPQYDSYQTECRVPIKRLSWNNIIRADPDWLYREIAEFDFTFGCGLAAAFMARLGLRVDAFYPYGSDVFEVPFVWSDEQDFEQYRDPSRYFFGKWQRHGLSQCRNLLLCDQGFKAALERIGTNGNLVEMYMPIVYNKFYQGAAYKDALSQCNYTKAFKDIRDAYKLVVFHHARQYWTNKDDKIHLKGNDVLIRGFAQFVKSEQATSACLVCFEYGQDVEASKQLIHDLGIVEHVKWMPMMHRRDIMVGLSLCDIGTGYFDRGWRTGGVLMEILVQGKPLVHHLGDYTQETLPKGLFDFVHVTTPNDISEFLIDYGRRPEFYAEVGRRGQHWFHESTVDPTMSWSLRAFVQWARQQTEDRNQRRADIKRLSHRVTSLKQDLAKVQEKNRRSAQIADTLFGSTGPSWPNPSSPWLNAAPPWLNRDLSWHIRAGQEGQRLLGARPLDDLPPAVKDHIREVAGRLGVTEEEERTTGYSPLERMLDCTIDDRVARIEADEALGNLAEPLAKIVKYGGWRRLLLDRVIRMLGR